MLREHQRRLAVAAARAAAGACGASETALDADTKATLSSAISSSTDPNPHVRDITPGTGGVCHASLSGVSSIGASITVDGACWTHVHPNHLDVLDFSYWASNHEGNKEAEKNGRRNPITAFAEQGSAEFQYPAWHDMDRWEDETRSLSLIHISEPTRR